MQPLLLNLFPPFQKDLLHAATANAYSIFLDSRYLMFPCNSIQL